MSSKLYYNNWTLFDNIPIVYKLCVLKLIVFTRMCRKLYTHKLHNHSFSFTHTHARTQSLKETEIIAAYVLLKEKVCTQTDPKMLCFGIRLAKYFVLFTQTVVRNQCFYISDDSLFVFCINLLIFPPGAVSEGDEANL